MASLFSSVKQNIPVLSRSLINVPLYYPAVKNPSSTFQTGSVPGASVGAVQDVLPDASSGSSGSSTSTYSPGYGSLISLYQNQLDKQNQYRQKAYDDAADLQQKNYDYNVGRVNAASDNALREAYVNKMLSEKNMQQNLSAQGITGGAAESTLAGLYNNYGSARNNIETQRAGSIADLGNTYQNNLAAAAQNLYEGKTNDYSDYIANLAAIYAANTPTTVSTAKSSESEDAGASAMAKALLNDGQSSDTVYATLRNAGYSAASATSILNSLGYTG